MDPSALCLMDKIHLHPIVFFVFGNGTRFWVLFFYSASISYFITYGHFGFVKASHILFETWHKDKLCSNTLRGYDNLQLIHGWQLGILIFFSSKSYEYRFRGFPRLCLKGKLWLIEVSNSLRGEGTVGELTSGVFSRDGSLGIGKYWRVGGYYDFSFQSRFNFIATPYFPSLLLNNDSILLTNHRFILITYWVVKLFNFDLYWNFFRCNTIPPILLVISYLPLNRSMDIGEKKKLSDSTKVTSMVT